MGCGGWVYGLAHSKQVLSHGTAAWPRVREFLLYEQRQRRKQILSSPRGITCRWFLGYSWSPCLPTAPYPSAGTPSGMNPCRPCVCCHNLCEITSVSVLLCLGNPVSLELTNPSGSNNLSASSSHSSEPWGGRMWCRQSQSLPLSACCPVVGFCVSSHLLQRNELCWVYYPHIRSQERLANTKWTHSMILDFLSCISLFEHFFFFGLIGLLLLHVDF